MESLQLKINSINSVLTQIDNYYIKSGGKQTNYLRFDVGSEPNLFNSRVVMALERILRTSLCDKLNSISDEFLEKSKSMINKLN